CYRSQPSTHDRGELMRQRLFLTITTTVLASGAWFCGRENPTPRPGGTGPDCSLNGHDLAMCACTPGVGSCTCTGTTCCTTPTSPSAAQIQPDIPETSNFTYACPTGQPSDPPAPCYYPSQPDCLVPRQCPEYGSCMDACPFCSMIGCQTI